MRTSWGPGGATSTSSSLRGSPAAQQTAALQFMGFPTVDMDVRRKEGKRGRNKEKCWEMTSFWLAYKCGTPVIPVSLDHRVRLWSEAARDCPATQLLMTVDSRFQRVAHSCLSRTCTTSE